MKYPCIFYHSLLVVFVYGSSFAWSQSESGPLNAQEQDQGVLISEADQPVLFYQTAVKHQENRWPRSNYVHPIYDLDGEVMTEDFPSDHGHHRGVFWAWHQVWVGAQRLGDPWICKDFQWPVQSIEVSEQTGTREIDAVIHWQCPKYTDSEGKPISVVRETVTIVVHPSDRDHRAVDFRIKLLALVSDVRIGGSEDAKGYGGFSPRIQLSSKQQFSGPEGVVEPLRTAITAKNWINISEPNRRGLAIFVHPDNPSPNDQWILRRKGSMQNAAFPGAAPIALSTDQAIDLRYRLIIHRGDLINERLDALHREYAAQAE